MCSSTFSLLPSARQRLTNFDQKELVQYIRRRDPRWVLAQSTLSALAYRQAEQARLKADLHLAAIERAKEDEKQAAEYKLQDWQKVAPSNGKNGEDLWGEKSDEEEMEEEEENWCVACARGFRSGGAWEGHERSRKHAKNVERSAIVLLSFLPVLISRNAD